MGKRPTLPPELPDDRQFLVASELLRVAGEPSRLRILALIDRSGEADVDDMASALGTTVGQARSRLIPLRTIGLVEYRISKKWKLYRLTEAGKIVIGAARALLDPSRAVPTGTEDVR